MNKANLEKSLSSDDPNENESYFSIVSDDNFQFNLDDLSRLIQRTQDAYN